MSDNRSNRDDTIEYEDEDDQEIRPFNLELEEKTDTGLSKFKFYKDKLGIFLFLLVYVAIALQVIGVYITYDYREFSNLLHLKALFYFIAFLAVWSHLQASFTEPGKIIHFNNNTVLNFYIQTRHEAVKNAEVINKKIGKKPFKDDIDDSDDSSYDDTNFRPVSSVSEAELTKYKETYKIEINRCKQCCVVRIPRAHHCSRCHGYHINLNFKRCIMKMDHHCHWINNCVGQFNQKFFLLFNWYCFSGCMLSFGICGYFYLYVQSKE